MSCFPLETLEGKQDAVMSPPQPQASPHTSIFRLNESSQSVDITWCPENLEDMSCPTTQPEMAGRRSSQLLPAAQLTGGPMSPGGPGGPGSP
jgi:hypothetical protein